MEKQYQDYAIMGLKALKRAARRAVMDAQKKNQKIPIWKDGRIEYINPEIDTERIRLDCESEANHNLNRLLDKPGLLYRK
ncbi:MAG: hypothetical protein DRP19_03905 [Thermotogae bacterium]|nr:MAG: hypothetical protein DRP19_03905 [Thermotogota bacterium]